MIEDGGEFGPGQPKIHYHANELSENDELRKAQEQRG